MSKRTEAMAATARRARHGLLNAWWAVAYFGGVRLACAVRGCRVNDYGDCDRCASFGSALIRPRPVAGVSR